MFCQIAFEQADAGNFKYPRRQSNGRLNQKNVENNTCKKAYRVTNPILGEEILKCLAVLVDPEPSLLNTHSILENGSVKTDLLIKCLSQSNNVFRG